MVEKSKGFSLVEILIVIGIVGLVLTIVFFSLNAKQKETRDVKRMSDINLLRNALSVVKNETGSYDRSFCDLGAVSACAGKENSELLKFIPDLKNLKDPEATTPSCVDAKVCATSNCNYAFSKLDSEDYEIRFHLEKGVDNLPEKGCYIATPLGIRKF
jgi:prepilin-type N-terminal cleavage/methylation domain-containing protein